MGLEKVAVLVMKAKANVVLTDDPADVVALRAIGSTTEVVYADGGYDVWINGGLVEPDLSAADAAAVLASAYRRAKDLTDHPAYTIGYAVGTPALEDDQADDEES